MTAALRAALRQEGGLLAELAEAAEPAASRPTPEADAPTPPQIAASGPRAAGREAEYELLLEMILQGAQLHYGPAPVEPDLALLLGDQLYALGLARLSAIGDLDAVAALGDVISRVAQAHAEGRPELADAAWEAGAQIIGWGPAS